MLRLLLLFIAATHLYGGFQLFTNPAWIASFYGVVELDIMHEHLSMAFGAMIMVLGLFAALISVRPVHQRSGIILLAIAEFSLFIVDVVIVARGQMPAKWVLVEMAVLLLVCIGLVRCYPRISSEVSASAIEKSTEVGIQNSEGSSEEVVKNNEETPEKPLEEEENKK